MWYDKMFIELEEKKDNDRAIKMTAYMKNNFPFLGIQKPQLVLIIKPYIKAASKLEGIDWDFIFLYWQKNYREAQYAAVEYIYSILKKLTDNDIEKLKYLIITKSWWDITDSLDKVIGNLSLRYPKIHNIMLEWSESDNIWLRRVSIDYQQKFKEKTDTALLEKIISNNLGTNEFFINKAIGWSLREYSKINPQWVFDFIEKHREKMSNLSVREASKYLIL